MLAVNRVRRVGRQPATSLQEGAAKTAVHEKGPEPQPATALAHPKTQATQHDSRIRVVRKSLCNNSILFLAPGLADTFAVRFATCTGSGEITESGRTSRLFHLSCKDAPTVRRRQHDPRVWIYLR